MNIVLVDDHAVVRQGYASLLRAVLPTMEVREAASGEEALARVQEQVPNLVIMDFGLPGISGLETTRRLRQRLPQLRVLFFSMHDELPLVRQALEAGALGYLTKNSAPEVLIEAVPGMPTSSSLWLPSWLALHHKTPMTRVCSA